MTELLGHHEVLQVLVVCSDLAGMFRAFDEVSPLLQYTDDGKHLLVVNLVVALDGGQGLQEISDQVSFIVLCQHLRQDNASGKIRAVGFDVKGSHQVRGDQYRSGGDTLFETVKGGLLGLLPAPGRVVSHQVKE